MSVIYTITDKQGKSTERGGGAACFSQHYGSLKNYRSLTYFCPKHLSEPKPQWNYNWDPFTDQDVLEYVRLLKVMGLNFSMTIDDVKKEYVFVVPLEENPTMHNKMILNCLRYLGEDSFPGIVKAFLKRNCLELISILNS